MRRALIALMLVGACALGGSAGAATRASYPLKLGDAVDVVGTKIACYAITSNKKDGMACVLVGTSGKPVTGSYGAGLAVDGTAVITHLKADGSGDQVFKRKLAASTTVYRVHADDVFGFQISSTVSLGCRVINVTSSLAEPVYQGVKVSCWRATATSPLPNTYGVSISDKMAGVFRFDAKGNTTSWGVLHRQPTTQKTVRAAAVADPITGSWLLNRSTADFATPPAHTIVATSTGFDIVSTGSYKSGAPSGVTFSIVERASEYDDNPQCAIDPGAVIGHFTYTGTDSKGIRSYKGQMLKGQVAGSPATCTLIGLQGTYFARLAQWSDPAAKPSLADGPYNRFCIDEDAGGCYVAFDRKGGTAAPAAVATTTTTAAPATKTPATGLVPPNAKIPPDKRFASDHVAPTVRAVASSAVHGQPFYLDYYSNDNRGYAGETYRIYRGATLLKSWGILAGERDGRLQRGPATLPTTVSGKLTFCVGAQDLNRNRSRWSCAALTIS